MNKLFNNFFLLSCIFGISILHAMDDTPKTTDLEQANKELLQDIDHLLESGQEFHENLERLNTKREEYMGVVCRRQTELADEIISYESSRVLTRGESLAYIKIWVETIENMGKIKAFLDLNIVKDPQIQSFLSESLDSLQYTVNRFIEQNRLKVTVSNKQEPDQIISSLRALMALMSSDLRSCLI